MVGAKSGQRVSEQVKVSASGYRNTEKSRRVRADDAGLGGDGGAGFGVRHVNVGFVDVLAHDGVVVAAVAEASAVECLGGLKVNCGKGEGGDEEVADEGGFGEHGCGGPGVLGYEEMEGWKGL